MYRACIVVADASRARLFILDRLAGPGGVTEELVEHRDLVDPARRLPKSELFSDAHPGSSRTGSLQYTFDDHRDDHIATLDAAFARSIVDEVVQLTRSTRIDRLIFCAGPGMLGELRRARQALPANVAIDEVGRNLVRLSPTALRDQLAEYRLLPAPPARLQA